MNILVMTIITLAVLMYGNPHDIWLVVLAASGLVIAREASK